MSDIQLNEILNQEAEEDDDVLIFKFILVNNEEHAVNADTLANTILVLDDLLNAVAYQQGYKDSLPLKIQALKEGSFEFVLQIAWSASKFLCGIISKSNDIFQFVKNWMELHMHLPNKQPNPETFTADVHDLKARNIISSNNNVTYNEYNNCTFSGYAQELFEFVGNDSDVNAVALSNSGSSSKPLTIPREKFSSFTQTREISQKIKKEIVTTDLKIRTLNFDGKTKWSVIYNSENIRVSIEDTDFLDRVKKGALSFQANSVLLVKLQIVKEYDDMSGEFLINKSKYSIVKVLNTNSDQQMMIQFD